jgi:hypothetical protein
VKAPIAPIVHITARPKVVNSTDATVVSRKAPTNRVRTDAQVAAPPKAARRGRRGSGRLGATISWSSSGIWPVCQRMVDQGLELRKGRPVGHSEQRDPPTTRYTLTRLRRFPATP